VSCFSVETQWAPMLGGGGSDKSERLPKHKSTRILKYKNV
jgi:hypothetical protein